MVVNAIAPFEGKLIWVGTPNGGNTQSGEEWKSVEFVISYTDGKLQERNICLNAFGVDRVNRILSTPLGTTLRVTFQPTARQYNEKWYGKNEVFGITVIQPQAQPQQPAPQYPPQYPVQGTQMPPQTPAYQAPVYQQPVQAPAPQGFPAGLTAEDDIPF
jgi:hypothetical protein